MNLIFKAKPADQHQDAKDQFKQFLEEESVPMRRAFNNFVQTMLDDVSDAQIKQWIDNKDLRGFLKYTADYIDGMSDVLPETFVRAANAEIENLSRPGKFGIGKLGIEFDPGASSAADLAESNRLRFIRDFTTAQKDTVRAAISDALSAGEGPAAAARRFRSAIGLTENQYRAVQTYQSLLENNSRAALDRTLRDARFDRTIERTIANDDVLSAKQIERMVGRYTENMRNYRAETIARTETMRAINQAKQESWAQIAEQLGIKPTKVERIWISTLDDRVRDSHADMFGQTVTGLDTPFESGDGEELMYPGDPDASPEETINCLLPGNTIDAPDLTGTVRGYYDGQAFTIETSSGRKISVTANHPVLTSSGWKPACLVNEFDDLICYRRAVDTEIVASCINADEVPTLIEDIHNSGLSAFGREIARSVNVHGDVLNRQIDIKLQAGSLLFDFKTVEKQFTKNRFFMRTNMSHFDRASGSTFSLNGNTFFLTTPRSVGRCDLSLSTFLAEMSIFDKFCLTSGSWPHAVLKQELLDSHSPTAKELFKSIGRIPSFVFLDKVSRVSAYPFSGHVYSPQTVSGVYLSNDILSHNCRCTVVVRFPPAPRQVSKFFAKAFDPDQPRDEKGQWTGVGYHGTASDFNEFEARAPYVAVTGHHDTKGIYFSGDELQAHGYATMAAKRPGAGKRRIITANLTMKNPLDITDPIKRFRRKGMSFGDAKRKALEALTPEHDGIVFRGNSVNHPEYVVFHHSQIHVVTPMKKGFDPDEPRDEKGRWTSGGEGFTQDEQDAVKEYQGALSGSRVGGYANLQSYMRTGEPKYPHAWKEDEGKEIIGHLNSAFDKSGLPADKTLYRGIKLRPGDSMSSMKVGDTFSDKGVTSTSTSKNVVDDKFSLQLNRNDTVVSMKIKAPAGTRAIDIDKVAGNNHEKEVALAPNTKFKVTSIRHTGRHQISMNVDVVK